MSLTGRPLLLLLALIAIATPLVGVRLWSVWTGRGRTPFRVGLFVAAQLSAVLLSVVAANDYGQFYPSWTDLWRAAHPGSDHVTVTVRSYGKVPEQGRVIPAPAGPQTATTSVSQDAPVAHGRPGRSFAATPSGGSGQSRSRHSALWSSRGPAAPLVGPTAPAAGKARSTTASSSDPAVAPGSQLGLDTGAGDLTAADAHQIAAALHPLSPQDRWTQDGTVVRLPVPGDNGRPPDLVLAYLPPSYFAGGSGAARLPMVELLTGYPGTPTSLIGKVHAVDALRADLAAGTVSPMVFVMSRPVEPYPRDTECMDVPGGPSNMHYLSTDIPRVAAQVLQLSVPDLGVIGYSSGGYCALKLAMTFPGIYVGAGSMSGYYAAEPGANSGGDLFGHDRRVRQEADLNWRLDHLPVPNTALVLATARDEKGRDGFQPAENFLRRVRPPLVADELIRSHGGHNFGTWSEEFPDMLRWMDRHLKDAVPVGQPSHGGSGDLSPTPAAEPAGRARLFPPAARANSTA